MKRWCVVLVCGLLWPWSLLACDQCEVVVEVLDGDSIVIQQEGAVRTVHLVSVDAPQIDQPYGVEAKNYTEELLLHRVVSVEYIDKRQASDVISFDGKSLKWGLIRSGLAWYPKNHEPGQLRSLDDPLAKQERNIRRKKIGLWAEADPQPPWAVHRGSESLPDVMDAFGNCSLGSSSKISLGSVKVRG